MKQTLPHIRAVLPHSGNAVYLTDLISHDETTLSCAAQLNQTCLFADGDTVGSWVGIEIMAQAIAAFAGYHAWLAGQPVQLGFLLGTRQYLCDRSFFRLHERLVVNVEREFLADNGLGAFKCEIIGDGIRVAATLTVYQPDDVEAYLKEQD